MLFLLVGKGFVFACLMFGRHFLKTGEEVSFARRRSVAAKQKRNLDLSRGDIATLFCSFWSQAGEFPSHSCEWLFFADDLTLVRKEYSCNLDVVIWHYR